MAKKQTRSIVTILAASAIVAALAYAFWPRPIDVDMDTAKRGAMRLTIDEEGQTRVRNAYVVSSPVAGRLMRIEAEPGDAVIRNETVIAHMRPANPAALDIRTREQARAAVLAAEAALRVARADLNKAMADLDFTRSEMDRSKTLAGKGTASQATLDRNRRALRTASATRDTAEAAISIREAELANARAQLLRYDGTASAPAEAAMVRESDIPLKAPASGRILRVMQKSETTLPVGTPIMEIGDIDQDLEVTVDLLSTDAVQVSPGDAVLIDDWGGETPLRGTVERIDPWGFEKYSSLGVEEQRVKTVIRFTSPREERTRLGHGYRVALSIIIWQAEDTLLVASNALFRDGDTWAVFRVEDGRAQKTSVSVGKNNGLTAQILDGLGEGDSIILYPSSGIASGLRVTQRRLD